jgi:translation initiation factor IF-3
VRGSQLQAATGAFLVCRGHPHEHEENHISEPRINDRIRVPEVRLVGPNGEQVGIVRVEDALRLAAEADLDLVEVAPTARPPVCKLMDFGKFKYESDIKAREARRNQTNTVIKEIKLRPKIDPHDYGTKKGHVERFLKAGDKVKVTIMFRGREQSRPELGFRLLQKLAEDIGELGFVESTPKQDGRNMIMVIGPTRKKAEAKAEERRRREHEQASAPERPAPAARRAPVEPPVQTRAQTPVPTQAPTPEPAPAADPVQPPVETAVEAPVEAPVETPAPPPAADPVETPVEAATQVAAAPESAPTPAPANRAVPTPTAPTPAKKAAAKKAAPTAPKPTASKTATKPAAKPAAKTASKAATKTAAKKTAEKVTEPAADGS